MTSIVDTSVKIFRNDMANAPVLNGTAGSLVSLLDACLVTGFDVRTVTSLVVSGGIATAGISGSHSAMQDSVVLISGSSIAALNGEQKVLTSGVGSITFATAAADGVASGTMVLRMAPAGFEKVYGEATKAVYRSLHPQSYGMLLRVDDADPMVARVTAFETMSDIDTGTQRFPTEAQVPGGGYWAKSRAAGSTRVLWTLAADGRFFMLNVCAQTGIATPTHDDKTAGYVSGFGDLVSRRPGGDAFACALSAHPISDVRQFPQVGSLYGGSTSAVYMPRSFLGLGAQINTGAAPYMGSATAISGNDATQGTFPNKVDGTLAMSRRYVMCDSGSGLDEDLAPRADVPGLFSVPKKGLRPTFEHRSVIEGAGEIAGRRFLMLTATDVAIDSAPGTSAGFVLVDQTGPWR